MNTLNVWSNTTKYVCQACVAPGYANLALAYSYGVSLINTTANEINSGVVTFRGADASPENACLPGDFGDLQPVWDCGPIVSGQPYTPPVKYDLAEHPLPPFATCNISAPCPQQFLQVTGVPAGVVAVVVMTRLRRWDNTDPRLLSIPAPLPMPFVAPLQQPFIGTGVTGRVEPASTAQAPAHQRGRTRAPAE